MTKLCPAILLLLGTVSGFQFQPRQPLRSMMTRMSIEPTVPGALERRSLLASTVPASTLIYTLLCNAPSAGAVAKKKGPKVVVVGGAGWVGSHVSSLLTKEGCEVVSISRAAPDAQAAKAKKSLKGALDGVEFVSLDASTGDLAALFKGASAVVSCVGIVPGGKGQREGNGAVNVRVADAAKQAKVPRFVYLSVASQISTGPGKFIFGDYFKGKAEAEAAVVADFGAEKALIVRPTVIPGGGGPPAPPGVAPVSVDAVAKVVVAGALGRKSGMLDGSSSIDSAAASL